MRRSNNTTDLGEYNTAINVIGGLKDCSVIFKAINAHFNLSDSVKELVNQRNEFNLRTEKSRTRIEREVRKGFLQFKNEDHQALIQGIFTERVPMPDKELVLLWQFSLNNRLFREITTQLFMKTYYCGRASISKDDITAYLKEFLRQNPSLQIDWSESTIKTISTKYLNLMSKLEFLSPGKVKSFKQIRPSSEAQVLFIYFACYAHMSITSGAGRPQCKDKDQDQGIWLFPHGRRRTRLFERHVVSEHRHEARR